MDPYLTDWLDLVLRWLHVIAGIAWIGSSFYFVRLDYSLLPPKQRDAETGVGGEVWEIHGGGFYHVQKYRVAPELLPEPLHWFKWEAYTTWLSGFLLFVVLYYANTDLYLIDKSVADLSSAQAIAISVGGLVLGWVVYDLLCKAFGQNELLLAGSIFLLVVAMAYGMSNVFSARAVYIQVGAMLGTIMVGNVFFTIIPGQRELVAAKKAGRAPDPMPGIKAKQRSVHNNYFTLPVLFAMLGNHFPFTYGHKHGWLILIAIMAVGAWVRHFFNLRHRGKTVWAIPISGAIALALLALWIAPEKAPKASTQTARVDFAKVRQIIARRCTACHSAHPTNKTFTVAPKGVPLDTPEQIRAQAKSIEQRAVVLKQMPLGNVTHMTQEERDLLAAWIRQGAKIK